MSAKSPVPPTLASQSNGSQQRSQKSMTKAERRELQEQQRAAKAAAKVAAASATPSTPASSNVKQSGRPVAGPSTPGTPGQSRKPPKGATAEFTKQGKDGVGTGPADVVTSQTHGVKIFSHFGAQQKTSTSKGNIHPAIVRLGLLFAEFKITGANARCIATLTAFKNVIQDYSTPPNNTLSRHLMTHLSSQISYLVAARPMAVTMGNAIRQLKLEISGSDIDLPEQDAKDALCEIIDDYIRDRIIIAAQVIQETAAKKIKDGDVILTYARSSVVEKVLFRAYEEGKIFSVFVVDSRPMLEGKKLLASLSSAGIQCTYLLLPALGAVITEVSTVFIGAHSLHSNGAVYSRAGTALVSMMAKQHSVPVVVCCETYKFSDTVQLDSFTKNELAPTNEMFSTFPISRPRDSLALHNQPKLEILNPLFDLTPPTNITAVVTEVGIIPPNSISSIPLALGRQMI